MITKLEETIFHVIAMSVVVLNLRKIQYALLQFLFVWIIVIGAFRNHAIVQ